MAEQIYRISREYVWWRVYSEDDLTISNASVAILSDPAALPDDEGDWVNAELEGPEDDEGNQYFWIKLLVGPGGDLDLGDGLAEGDYPADFQTWVRIEDNPERPVRKPGVITVL